MRAKGEPMQAAATSLGGYTTTIYPALLDRVMRFSEDVAWLDQRR